MGRDETKRTGLGRSKGRSGPGRRRPPESAGTVWLFGVHAVRDALENPARIRHRLIVTPNALQRLGLELVAAAGIEPEVTDPRRFKAPLDPQSVHQGVALEADPLEWGRLGDIARPHARDPAPVVVVLDRVTDPHNAGAILRSAEVFGCRAVVAPRRHAAPESGALAKAASGALERQPYLRVTNLGRALEELEELGYLRLGLDGGAESTLGAGVEAAAGQPLALVLGAEGPGLRPGTREACDRLVRIDRAGSFGSLNVSNAAAVALFAARGRGTI